MAEGALMLIEYQLKLKSELIFEDQIVSVGVDDDGFLFVDFLSKKVF